MNSFETPKQDSASQEPRSPWGNTYANAISPSFKTPSFPTFSPTTPTARGTWSGKDLEAEIATHSHTSRHAGASLSFKDSSEQSGFTPIDFPDFDSQQIGTSDFSATQAKEGLGTSIETTVSSAGSMQTPPPTSTSASRRKAQYAQSTRLVKAGRRLSSPSFSTDNQQNVRFTQPEESPSQFSHLQLSPDGLGFPISGPATAPVYPQHKLFWDPDQSSNAINMDISMADTFTSFGVGSHKHLDPFVSDNDHGDMLPFTTSPAFNTIETSADISRSTHAPGLNQRNLSSSTAVIINGSSGAKHPRTLVDPSLLFSSPSHAPEKLDISSSRQPIQDEILQPYAHQIRDAQIEKELRSRKHKRKRAPENGDSPAVKAAIEALREDGSDVSRSSPVLADSFVGALPDGLFTSSQDIPSRKRMTPDSQYRRRESQRHLQRGKNNKVPAKHTAVSLKIDPSGRAVTETKVISSRPKSTTGSKMDIDSVSEDSESSSSLADTRLSYSQQLHNPSLNQKQTRQAGFGRDYRSHSQRPSNASTLASTSTNITMQGMTNQGHLITKAGHAQAHFPSSQSFSGHDDEDESEAETIVDSDEDNGGAQSELRKVVRERDLKKASNRSSWSACRSDFVDRSQSSTTTAPAPHPYYTNHNIAQSHFAYQEPPINVSPTTITDPEMATPSSGRQSNISSDSTRCVCNMADGSGQLMIQW